MIALKFVNSLVMVLFSVFISWLLIKRPPLLERVLPDAIYTKVCLFCLIGTSWVSLWDLYYNFGDIFYIALIAIRGIATAAVVVLGVYHYTNSKQLAHDL